MKGLKGMLAAVLLLCMLPLAGCVNRLEEEGLLIYASFYPFYAVTQGVAEGAQGVSVRCLVQPYDSCPRAYELSDWDVRLISYADLVFLGGRGFESFEGSWESSAFSQKAAVRLMDGVELINEGDPVSVDEDASHFDGPNPWAFLSFDGAEALITSAASNLIYLDEQNEGIYHDNEAALLERLDAVRAEAEALLIGAELQPVGILHEGLQYIAQDFGVFIGATYEREPGQDLDLSALEEAVTLFTEADVRVLFIERQAPDRLKRELDKAGFILAEMDTTLTRAPEGTVDGYFEALNDNARAASDAFLRAAGQTEGEIR